MPKNTCRPSECVANGNGDKANGNQNDGTSINNNNNNNVAAAGSSIVKQEFDAAPPVCHRKSERRKIARDIFLVFEEEQPARRRGRGGARGKNTRAKQKFGHLKVANTPRTNKNILREIKTEPKCITAAIETVDAVETDAVDANTTVAVAAADVAGTTIVEMPSREIPDRDAELVIESVKSKARMASVKIETKPIAAATVAAAIATVATTVAAAAAIDPVLAMSPIEQLPLGITTAGTAPITIYPPAAAAEPTTPTATVPTATVPTSTPPVVSASPKTPSVNPIFLWVKQDDTRIVEVRCEDYDKRNRIRLTKTTNGWRSMPRTDASSSRIVKFFHNGAAPLMKVKREQMQQQHSVEREEHDHAEEQQLQLQQHHHPTPQMHLHDWTVVQDAQEQEPDLEDEHVHEHDHGHDHDHEDRDEQISMAAVIENVVVMPAHQQPLEATSVSPDVCFDALLDSETNASTKATKTSTSNANTPTYQSAPSPSPPPSPSPVPSPSPLTLELQLCPKTGLFLRKGATGAEAPLSVEATDNARLDEQEEDQEHETGKPLAAHTNDNSSLDANTKNLKDLLDDADDLLQNCGSDNGSNGADLLDSLVKRSCEDNLMQESRQQQAQAAASTVDGLSSFCVPDMVAGKELPSILGMDSSDAPKCLSFNEAGEIEGLNGDLFLGIDSFDKQPEAEAEAATEVETVLPANLDKEQQPATIVPDEAPKDLSYKKREEVCPPSESRSQCAVTSSSDILKSKSPEPDMQPATNIPAEVETTSETIKHLILEQFLKLNGNAQQQAEPMDLGKTASSRNSDKLHTVVIDDEDEEVTGETEHSEPLKKRAKAIKMDKDPDPLTQLKMLISNPQWKVPDPILVPKDRLGAVLASPAREIPLLLTTRPELRLPEAFAYPEIIQNPNILVVTMEQLEAILKNDADQSKAKPNDAPSLCQTLAQLPCSKTATNLSVSLSPSPSPSRSPVKHHKPVAAAAAPHKTTQQFPPKVSATTPAVAVAPLPSTSPAVDSSMSTELNATTLALLQQMLWLPYFGQLSQEFFKTLKDPLGLQRKFMSNLLPLYNSQFGLQHLDELYKHCLKQKSINEEHTPVATPTPASAPASTKQPTTPTPFNGYSNPMELAFMQKLLQQHQQQQQQTQSKDNPQHHHLEHKRPRREPDATPLHIPDFHSNFNKQPPKQQTQPVAVATTTAASASVSLPVPTGDGAVATAAALTTQTVEHKPRLTCKSLSNLLEPESNVVPLLNVPFDGMRRASMHKTPHELTKESNNGRTLRSSKASVTYNPVEQTKPSQSQSHHQQRKRGNMLAHEVQQQQQQQHLAEAAAVAAAAAAVAGGGGSAAIDANSALWHPLFGSNPKQGYNSPWQWTTVTATGE